MPVIVSVVVPTFRREQLLDRCLAALASQDFPPECFEVIVSDNAGSRTTERLTEKWARSGGPTFRYVSASRLPGPAAARNRGWQAAHGSIIAFTDDDCIPSPTWLRHGMAGFVDSVAGVWGQVIVPVPERNPTDYQVDASKLERAEFVNANCFYRRDALAHVQGFDERFEAAWREDSDLYFRLLESGYRLSRAPEAVVVHPPRQARWGVSLWQQRKNMFNALLYKKHPTLYRQRIQAAPPWQYYLGVGSLAAALTGFASGAQELSLGAFCVWLMVTGHFCARRLAGTSRSPNHVIEMIVTSALIPPLAVYWRLRGAFRYRVWFL
ncbi:MAG TPA: glycosyltransferase [Acidobacteriota bacterium]|jgi:GT2 family glycosyltransferase|nr:glycosyltransferase [Acidobacteriota bacterium]